MIWLPVHILVFLIFLVHLPLVVDILKQLFPTRNIQRLTSNASSVLLICLLSLFLLFGLGMQLFVFVPLLPQVSFRALKLTLHCCLAYWMWLNIALNYCYVLFSKPSIFWRLGNSSSSNSSSTPQQHQQSHGGMETSSNDNLSMEKSTTEKLFNMKDPGTESDSNKDGLSSHYCKTCSTQISYRDHHCPFTGNCIGLNNFSYFYLTLFYSMLGLGYSISVSFFYFGHCFSPAWNTVSPIAGDAMQEGVCKDLEPYGEIIYPAIGGFVTVTVLFFMQTLLLMANVSTHELLKRKWRTRFNPCQFLREGSHFRVMLLEQRTHPVWFLLPVRNRNIQCQLGRHCKKDLRN